MVYSSNGFTILIKPITKGDVKYCKIWRLFITKHFDDTSVLGPDVHAVGFEVEEISAGGGTLGGRIPPVGLRGYILLMINLSTRSVIDRELAILEAVVLYQSADDEAVVHTVAVGGDYIGVG